MSNRFWQILAVTALIALGAGVGIGAAAWSGEGHGGSGTSLMSDTSAHDATTGMTDDGSMDGDMSGLDERTFMEMMVPHHQSAIDMAEVAIEKAQRPQVKRLARAIVTAQEAEIARMETWYESWYGEKLVPSMSGPHGDADMSELESAKDDFDRVFLRMMTPHHASAIMMADAVMMNEPRSEIEALANEIIAAQAKEIGQMQRWREQWYPPLG